MENSEKPSAPITGAGIGAAHAFADTGYRVIVTDILEEESCLPSRDPGHEVGRGSMIAVFCIVASPTGGRARPVLGAAKAGVVGLVRALAVEFAPDGMRVNGITPGYIRTAQALSEEHSLGPEGLERAAGFIPMDRAGEPEDIADVTLFLASEAVRY